jgi:capsular exopolysaccharide synthesis family protein
MLGLLLGAAAAFLRAFLDTSVHSRADVQLLTGLPVVGLIPRIETRRQRLIALVTDPKARQARARGHAHTVLLPVRRRRSGSSNSRPHSSGAAPAPAEHASGSPHASAIAEAYSVLQTNIVHTSEGGRIRCIVFTSALPGEGKTTSAVNLALTLARRGLKALLVDADLPRGVVHRIFDLPRADGLADALQNELPVGAVCRTVDVGDGRTLDVVTAGASGTRASGLLDSETMRTFIQGCRDAYDAVILDAPPVNVIADAALLGMQADGVVMVARVGVTESAALAYAIDQLRHVNAPLVGVLLNDIDFRRDAIYDPTYRYCDYSQYVAAAAK